ncbi:hypothetical protein DSO57_1002219 [Entomophthora muscae]|uniref:Uncharacterized protein n=1 Tax=Entomophthora muscae TaxID=34485 RepID=A0ACC2U701_9FUNG|nr:hypothetical protein DSO57_1002219 [Entomophthora muscae]
MKLIIVAWLPPLGVVIGTPLSAIISSAQSVSLGGPSSSASAHRGSTPEKCRQAVPQSIDPAAHGNPGSGFDSCSWAWGSRGGELSILTGLEKIMQGYTGSSNSKASVYGHSQPAGPSARTTQESVLSPATSSMAVRANPKPGTGFEPLHLAVKQKRGWLRKPAGGFEPPATHQGG